ncbi:TetR family transcriptional regulator [Hydrogenophaga crassostreae]|uniref:TetR family transcriptional regulator n=1 Tax=Hydrogenophaga crassostreae TaxID=1763535 RepID=A0A167GUZ8_9BURK|nr:TetR/AcrR family transcriptional regulator [Hydrogenophaga crassostreae]AOW11631.1 TetR family transcriptional regulator [Hydrogenophaga crassostreae]OAD39918.1 TetR family transcriptional regulator [Hydrogenophaga crassostreae]
MAKPAAPTSKPRRAPAVAVRTDRRADILLAAEKLFAQNGYDAVSIRQIATEAQVPLALVGYYFGQKHELFHAIFEHWGHTIAERLALLSQARASPRDGQTLERMVGAFIDPVMRMRASPEGEYYALLVARELSYRTTDASRVLADYFDPMAHAFIDALQEACPGSEREDAAWAYQFALGALIHHMSDERVHRLSLGEAVPFDPAATPRLVKFVTAGIAAVLGQPAAPARSRSRSRPFAI